jgi:DNA-binding protein H-NS
LFVIFFSLVLSSHKIKYMLHPTLPQTMTKENLAVWIRQNSIEGKNHVVEIEYTEKEIQEFEHKSSAAARAIDKLEAQLKKITEYFKKGTQEPIDEKIYPTKGIEVLKANRKYADDEIEKGFREETTVLFGIPYPEKKQVIFVDIEGIEFTQYTRNMTKEEAIGHTTLFSEDEKAATRSVTFGSVTITPDDLDFLDEK